MALDQSVLLAWQAFIHPAVGAVGAGELFYRINSHGGRGITVSEPRTPGLWHLVAPNCIAMHRRFQLGKGAIVAS